MRVSLHRRRHQSLPPRQRRPLGLLGAAVLVTAAGVAWGTQRAADDGMAPTTDPAVDAAEQSTRTLLDLRVRAHLRALDRGESRDAPR